MNKSTSDKIIAGLVTLFITALIIVTLVLGGLTWDKSLLAETYASDSTEELFIEPDILEEDPGEELPDIIDEEAAPAPQGEPEPAEADNREIITPGENPEPAPAVTKPATQKKPSPVKAVEPKKTEEKEKKATSVNAVKNAFSKNGSKDSKKNGTSVGKSGVSTTGSARGRKFMGCPHFTVAASERTVVKVRVTVNAAGKVVSASVSSGGNAEQKAACLRAAKQAKWSEKPGAADATGTITFTITPKA